MKYNFFEDKCDHVVGLWLTPIQPVFCTNMEKSIGMIMNHHAEYDDYKGMHHIDLHSAWLDKKKMPHKRFKFCPYCGVEIPWDAIHRRLRRIDEQE